MAYVRYLNMDVDAQIEGAVKNLKVAFGQVEHLQTQRKIWAKISKKHPNSKSLKGRLGQIESQLRDAKFDIKNTKFDLKASKILKGWIEV